MMAVTFITGRAGSGKTTLIHNEIVEDLLQNPSGPPILLIVPEQMTFQTEKDILQKLGRAYTRLHVLSLPRLAVKLLEETGGAAETLISETGIHTLIRRVFADTKEEWQLYRGGRLPNGFISQAADFLKESRRYHLDTERMQTIYEALEKEGGGPGEKRLQAKLHDLLLMKRYTEEALSGRFVESEDLLLLGTRAVKPSEFLTGAVVYLDGFHSFTPLEETFLTEVMTCCQVKACFTGEKVPDNETWLDPLDLFFETENAMQRIQLQLPDTDFHVHHLAEVKRFSTPALNHLEKTWAAFPAKPGAAVKGVRLWEAVDRRTEVEHCARRISGLVRKGQIRYRDIAVVTRNMDAYEPHIETIFPAEDIPYFSDRKRYAHDHPFTEFMKASLEAIDRNWPYDAVFRLLKTGYLFSGDTDLEWQKLDIVENYVLERGIRGEAWKKESRWEEVPSELEKLDDEPISSIIKRWTGALRKLERALQASSETTHFVKALYTYTEDSGIPKTFLAAETEETLRENEQLWKEWIRLLEDMNELGGRMALTRETFAEMIEAGLDALTFSIIPPAFDQVTCADAETSRLSSPKMVFLLGVNEGVFPLQPGENGYLSEDERKMVKAAGGELAPDASEQLMNEQYVFYRSLTQPSHQLYISWALSDDEGRRLQPSLYVRPLQERLPELEVEVKYPSPADHDWREQTRFVTNPKRTLGYTAAMLKEEQGGYSVPLLWHAAESWYKEKGETRLHRLLQNSLNYKNEAAALTKEEGARLYGKKLKASVSRLEQYNACPFSQFAGYGLKLKERKIHKLEAPDIGVLFHEAMKEVTEKIQTLDRPWDSFTKEETSRMAEEAVSGIAPRIQRDIFKQSHRYDYLLSKLTDVVSQASWMMSEHARRQDFVPVGMELSFGLSGGLPPLMMPLPDGTEMEMRGIIDRVDRADTENGTFLRIIDYKSSQRDIQLDDIYYGLSLQMLVYLDVILAFSHELLGVEADAAGMLYFHLHNPLLKEERKLSEEEVEEELLKKFKMKGLLSSDPSVIKASDHTLDSGYSTIVPVQLKKSGEAGAKSKTISQEDFAHLRSYVRNHLQLIGRKLMEGDTSITPYRKKNQVPCQFCSFRAVCQFDPSFAANTYRSLKPQSPDQIMNKIREEDHDENET
ncbi:helicase-exonuclease AddAB subunit AddB [Alkalicoccus urumqiensis]|uniref:Helicase-exonuclease AddAB subunit AddB n=1 Tax=Alkalicoccus urumqiensis TaxID=1548213 RepID=A0A2P6MKU5_ALKUR|nr:helicase-exonuclease AddAB subunit AddB [Alkalicoccus urumqiensis]PRO66907.1 helicase-exonuclease AddAB subunit AddB [Alkalicoccus urumqiensis]